MVKIDKIPTEKSIPNVSTVIINDDSVETYLFADSFSGLNRQVGYIKIENIFIDDRRKGYMLPKPINDSNLMISNHFRTFFKGMISEYNRHSIEYEKKKINSHSWLNCDSILLHKILHGTLEYNKISYDSLIDNPTHLFDVALTAMFLYIKIIEEGKKT